MLDILTNFLDHSNLDALLVRLSNSEIRNASPSLVTRWNCTSNEIIGKKIRPTGHGSISCKTNSDRNNASNPQVEVTYTPLKGVFSTSNFQVKFFSQANEKFALLYSIDNQTRAAQSTSSAEHRLNLALRSGGYALWDHDFESGETYNSPEMELIFGEQIDGQSLNYLSFERLVHPDDVEKSINAKIRTAAAGTEVFQTRSRIRTNNGKYAWIETVASLARDPITALPRKCVGLCRNIDHEMLTMERLKSSELMLKRTQAVSHIGSFKLRVESGVSRLTAELAAMIGLSNAMVHPNLDTFIKMIESSDKDKFLEALELAKIGRQIKNLEISVRSHSGNVEWFTVTMEPERGTNGQIDSIFGACQLITERKNLEDRFHQAQKMEAVGQLTGGIAHDFNNLLMVVMGNLQLVEKRVKDDPTAQKRILAAIDAADKGSNLTRRMLAFSRQQTLQNKDIEVNTMLLSMQDMLQQAVTAAVNLQFLPAQEVWNVKADKTMLETAVLNLVINARDAMGPSGGKLIVESNNKALDASNCDPNEEVKPGDYVEISVTDTGSGIAPENLSKVFQPFFTTKGPEAGSGLGLSMIYGFVKQSGGHVKILSEVGIGTSVKIYLPRHKSNEDHKSVETISNINPAQVDSPVETMRKKKILVVEDNSSVRDVAAAMIEEMGYETITASNGHEGLATIETTPDVDLMLSDVIMAGGMNGAELAAKAIKLRPDLRVLFMSGYAPGSVRQMQDLPGEIELVNKPFTRNDLREKVRRALNLPTAA